MKISPQAKLITIAVASTLSVGLLMYPMGLAFDSQNLRSPSTIFIASIIVGVGMFLSIALSWDAMMSANSRERNPVIGAFTQMDPAGQEQNPYLYAAADPINNTDPTGLSCGGALFWAAADTLAAGWGIYQLISAPATAAAPPVAEAKAAVGAFAAIYGLTRVVRSYDAVGAEC